MQTDSEVLKAYQYGEKFVCEQLANDINELRQLSKEISHLYNSLYNSVYREENDIYMEEDVDFDWEFKGGENIA